MPRPIVLVTEGSDSQALEWLKERADVRQIGPADGGFAEALAVAEGMVVRTYTKITVELLEKTPKLRVVGRGGVGLESIDVKACRARGVEVVYTPDANTRAVAEFVFGLMVKLVRPWHANALDFTDSGFKRLRQDAGEHLYDLKLGILGMGRVGRAVGRIAHHGFGMSIQYHDLADVSGEVDVPAKPVDFQELLTNSDVLTVHVDGRPGNRHLIDTAAIAHGAFGWLINTSRGAVVDAVAVESALRSGRLAGCALDVFDPEPPTPDSAYARLQRDFADRVLLTPHMASRTKPATENMSWVVRDVLAVLNGEPPRHPAP